MLPLANPQSDTHLKSSNDNLLATGKIHRTFGFNGYLKVESYSGELEHLKNLKKVYLQLPETKLIEKTLKSGWYEVEDVNIRHSDALFKFKGVQNEFASELNGSEIYIQYDEAPSLNDGEFYISDLCKCDLVCEGEVLGKITNITEGGSSYLLELSEAATGRLVLIPFNKEFIGEINLENRTVELMHRWILE